MMARWSSIECVVVASEAEALLAEQSFIKQYRPRFNIRLRDDKSYPFIAISLDEDFPRVYFTRERHRAGAPTSARTRTPSACARRSRCSPKVFMFRSCTGPEPGRRSGSPCLDYYIKRCEAPCVGLRLAGGLPPEHRRRDRVPLRALHGDRARAAGAHARGRGGGGVRAGDARAQPAARGALAAGAPARRERVGRHAGRGRRRARRAGTPTRRSSRCATGCCPTASPSTSPTRPSASGEVAEEFMLQYYGGAHRRSRRCWSSSASSGERSALAEALAQRRGGPVELRAAERGEKRRILELAERNARARARSGAAARRAPAPAPRGGARGAARALGARRAADADRVLRHLATSAAPTPSPRWSCSRAARRRSPTTAASRSARQRGHPTTTPRWRRCSAAASPSGSARPTSPRTTPPMTRASPRCPT